MNARWPARDDVHAKIHVNPFTGSKVIRDARNTHIHTDAIIIFFHII
jgi:hypothetical protein